MAPSKSINHLQQTSYLLYEKVECVCVVSKNQYLVSNVRTAEPRVRFPTAERVCCSSSDALVLLQTQRCWPFEWDSQIFFYMVVFV